MKSISVTLLCLLLSSLTIQLDGGAASIEDTCKGAAAASPVINYDFCVSTFLGNPKSGSADTRGLAKIAALTAINHAANIKIEITDLLKKSPDPEIKSALNQCFRLYDSMSFTLANAADAINAERDEAAKGFLKTGIQEAEDCAAAFEKAGKASPLTKGNRDSVELSTMSLAILDLIAKKPSDHDDMMIRAVLV
ncbi:hypothetical protein J5N97_001808 [Dioscorea zingiberensis]|uniref:Pectinesterase inhibitor domain-containing protein n=1 Tax=Dioscorea zingiberensis TaxID=325984 RepID=A0A9D5BTD7_9LILI|nr:hypothetical protein J5N97_001808 [Dioscorea zingiberensis]